MTIPSWANPDITKLLPKIRREGEGLAYEFKECFPEQGHVLAKEVAAFATSGGGLILIGVRDDGTVSGLNEDDRDKLGLQAQGIASNVEPRAKIDVRLCYDEKFILSICVRNDQTEPVYYYDHRPYIRDGSMSRPATPDEVKERVWSHPSSEQRKRMEDMQYRMAQNAAEQSAKRTAAWDDLAVKSANDRHERMSRSIDSTQTTNEMVRRSVVPKK